MAFGLVALASLIEACGDETALTACELLGALAGAGRGRPEADKEALWSASAVAIGCDLPDMSNGFNPQGTSQIPPILHDLEGNASFKIEHNVARFFKPCLSKTFGICPASQAIADWFQCIMNACDEQEGDKCLDEEELTQAKAAIEKKIERMNKFASRPRPTGRPGGRPGRPGRPSGPGN